MSREFVNISACYRAISGVLAKLPFKKTRLKVRWFVSWLLVPALVLSNLLTGCTLPQVTAEQGNTLPTQEKTLSPAQERRILAAEKRIFLDLSLEFLGEFQLPPQTFEDTPVGGLSGIAYDRKRDRFYAISDDPSGFAPARFYTLRLALNSDSAGEISIQNVEVEGVTQLIGEDGQPFERDLINPEGIAYAPPNSIFVASEGIANLEIPPFVQKFDLNTGQWQQNLPIPPRYIPDRSNPDNRQGVQNNLGFESLTVDSGGVGEPLRLFTATEMPLEQDRDPPSADQEVKNRLMHYLISDLPPLLISEHLYLMDTGPRWSVANGLTELLTLGRGGHFLSLERSLGFLGYGAKIYQLATGAATDTSAIASLKGELRKIEPVRKKLLLDLSTLGITLDNLEGMTLGPRLPDGTESLLLVSDNNFDEAQVTQFLLFRLKQGH